MSEGGSTGGIPMKDFWILRGRRFGRVQILRRVASLCETREYVNVRCVSCVSGLDCCNNNNLFLSNFAHNILNFLFPNLNNNLDLDCCLIVSLSLISRFMSFESKLIWVDFCLQNHLIG